MNRLLFVCNLVLSSVLVVVIACESGLGDVFAADRGSIGASELHVLRVDDDDEVWRWMLHFGTPMVERDAIGGEPVDLGLVLEPNVPLQSAWHDERTLVLNTVRPLARATRYTLHLSRDLRALDGRIARGGLQKTLSTPSVRVRRVVVDDDDDEQPGSGAAFLIGFDVPVELASLRETLRVRSRGRRIATSVAPSRLPGENAFRVRLPPGSGFADVEVVVPAGLRPVAGDIPMTEGFRTRVSFEEPLRLGTASLRRGAIELDFNRTVPLPGKGMIRLRPDVPFQVRRMYDGLRILSVGEEGGFQPGSTLRVILAKGFPGSGRAILPAALERSLLVPDAEPQLGFAQAGTVLSSLARPELQIRGVNVAEFGVSVRRLYENNVVRFVQGADDVDATFGPAAERFVAVKAARNESFSRRVDLDELLRDGNEKRGKHATGIFRVRLWDRAHDVQQDRANSHTRVIQITDLGVTFRAARGAVAVQVVSLATGKPVADADVSVITPTNQHLVSGRTGADGVVVMPYAETAADREPFMVQVRKGEDLAFVDLRGFAVELTDDTLSGRAFLTRGHEAFVHPSRGVVRPGGTLSATVVVRDAAGIAPVGHELRAVFIAPGGRDWSQRKIEVPGAGLIPVTLAMSITAPTGGWRLEVREADGGEVIGSASFAVQAFVPNRLEAEIEVLEPLRIGATARVRVRGRWLDGAPSANRPIVLRVRLDRGRFRPEGFARFSFEGSADVVPPGALPSVRGQLDAEGESFLRFTIPGDVAPQVLKARLTVEVQDPSGRAVRESIVAAVLRPRFQLGVRATADGAEVVAVDAGGGIVPCAESGEVTLEWRHYEWDLVRGRYGWRYRTEVRAEQVAVRPLDLRNGRQVVRLPAVGVARTGGWYVVVARCAGQVCEQTRGSVPARPDRLRVRGPRLPVAPGGIAKIQVDAPAAGRGFVTLEGNGVHGTTVVAIHKGHTEIEVPIPAGLGQPNVHAVVTLTRPMARRSDPGPFWLVGGASIPLSHVTRGTTVGLEGPAEVRPESQVDFAIHAKGASAATVALVDEGVLDLTRHADPDPLAFFLARRRLDSRGADIGGFLMNRVRFRPGVKTGGDGGSGFSSGALAGSVSSRIRPVALFVGEVKLDAEGRGRVRFDLPPYEGRLRLMVVAAGARVVGGASRGLLVKAPLSLQVAMPRMLSPGDRAVVPITLKNHTGVAGVADLVLVSHGGLRIDAGQSRATIALRADEVTTLDIGVTADVVSSTGDPRVQVTATLGEHRRVVSARTIVRRPAVFSQEVLGLCLEGEQDVKLPGTWSKEGLSVELRVDHTPDVQLRGALESLLDYPYGCLEQTTSRCIGLLSCQTMLPRMLGDAAPDVLPYVQAGVDRIFSMQCPDGAFAWWPGQRSPYRYGTVHALDFILAARQLGADVPARGLRRAVDALVRMVADRDSDDELSLRCHAVEVLSRAGRPVQPWLDFLAGIATALDDRARVAMALARDGQTAKARALLVHDEFEDLVGVACPSMLRSPMRSKAMELRARLALGGIDARILGLVQHLGRVMARPSRYTTQEKAYALRALADYYRSLPARASAVGVVITQGDRRWSLDEIGTLKLDVDPNVAFHIKTEGRAYAWLQIGGQRVVEQELRSDRMSLRSSIKMADSGESVDRFERGRVYEITVHCSAPEGVDNLLVTHLLPGGFEVEPPRPQPRRASSVPCHVERRDDRVLIFIPGRIDGDASFRFEVRAVFPGRYSVPALRAEAMYDPELRCSAPRVEPVTIEP